MLETDKLSKQLVLGVAVIVRERQSLLGVWKASRLAPQVSNEASEESRGQVVKGSVVSVECRLL